MKKKEIIYLVLAAVIFVAVGFLAYNELFAKKKPPKEVTVEVIDPIAPDFDAKALQVISDAAKVKDFSQPIDVTTGLGNPAPFNPL